MPEDTPNEGVEVERELCQAILAGINACLHELPASWEKVPIEELPDCLPCSPESGSDVEVVVTTPIHDSEYPPNESLTGDEDETTLTSGERAEKIASSFNGDEPMLTGASPMLPGDGEAMKEHPNLTGDDATLKETPVPGHVQVLGLKPCPKAKAFAAPDGESQERPKPKSHPAKGKDSKTSSTTKGPKPAKQTKKVKQGQQKVKRSKEQNELDKKKAHSVSKLHIRFKF